MRQISRMVGVAAIGVALLSPWTSPATAACKLVKATHSAGSPAEAAQMSRELALASAGELKRANGWSSMSLTARKVKGDPFWKMVRPDGVPDYAQLKLESSPRASTPPASPASSCPMSAPQARASAGNSHRRTDAGQERQGGKAVLPGASRTAQSALVTSARRDHSRSGELRGLCVPGLFVSRRPATCGTALHIQSPFSGVNAALYVR